MEKLVKVQAVLPRKNIAIAGAAALVVCVAAFAVFWLTSGGELEARIMEIFSVDGPEVSLTRGVEATVAASVGARLHDGYGVFTGEDSICHIRLDAYSLVRMDSLSKISVNQATATSLSILVEDGQVLIDVQNQYPGHELEVIVGNAALGVRGTLFIAGYASEDTAHVIMLEGSIYVDGEEPVSAGYVMMLLDDEPQEVSPLRVEDLDVFAMQAILDYQERVLEAGAITEEELEWIIRRMSVPDYIWIQGVQISTGLTEMRIVSDINDPTMEHIEPTFEMSLTNADIESLAYMRNLSTLRLMSPLITDISPLAELTDLTIVNLSGNQISDISPLVGLSNLTNLVLHGNQISDISPLAGLISLTNLGLASNQISDISILEGLSNLVVLNLHNNQIGDISPLAGLTNLYHVLLQNNLITDWSPVTHVETVHGRP